MRPKESNVVVMQYSHPSIFYPIVIFIRLNKPQEIPPNSSCCFDSWNSAFFSNSLVSSIDTKTCKNTENEYVCVSTLGINTYHMIDVA